MYKVPEEDWKQRKNLFVGAGSISDGVLAQWSTGRPRKGARTPAVRRYGKIFGIHCHMKNKPGTAQHTQYNLLCKKKEENRTLCAFCVYIAKGALEGTMRDIESAHPSFPGGRN